MNRHNIMESMFANPIMLDDLDFLYKNDMARKVLFFYQPKGDEVEPEEDTSRKKDPRERKNQGLAVLASKDKEADEEVEMVVVNHVMAMVDEKNDSLVILVAYHHYTQIEHYLKEPH